MTWRYVICQNNRNGGSGLFSVVVETTFILFFFLEAEDDLSAKKTWNKEASCVLTMTWVTRLDFYCSETRCVDFDDEQVDFFFNAPRDHLLDGKGKIANCIFSHLLTTPNFSSKLRNKKPSFKFPISYFLSLPNLDGSPT